MPEEPELRSERAGCRIVRGDSVRLRRLRTTDGDERRVGALLEDPGGRLEQFGVTLLPHQPADHAHDPVAGRDPEFGTDRRPPIPGGIPGGEPRHIDPVAKKSQLGRVRDAVPPHGIQVLSVLTQNDVRRGHLDPLEPDVEPTPPRPHMAGKVQTMDRVHSMTDLYQHRRPLAEQRCLRRVRVYKVGSHAEQMPSELSQRE
jgi:hypothetical protein